ncbi:hypothetical protein [Vreelandella massiliensis]|uniref:portal protein n=1 Tax=Vreelandella massiliensis TaxID=1816686 RepID=UPI00096A6F80|nr:hypothetical protein [Halomonas massiliensis]
MAKTTPQTGDDTLIAQRQWGHYVRARDNGHADYVKMAIKCDEFYRGDQWSEHDRKKLEDEGRPAMTFNLVLSTINTALGEQSQREMQVGFLPKREATRDGALVLSKVAQSVMQANDYHFTENFVFADGMIQDRGFFDVRISFEENLMGDVSIKHLDPLTVIPDPEAKEYDPSTWNEVMVTTWMSLDEIKTKYGQRKADSVASLVNSGEYYAYDSIRFGTNRFGGESFLEPESHTYEGVDDRTIRSVRVIERQHYQWVDEYVLVDPDSGDMREAPSSMGEEEATALAEKYGIQVIKRPGRKVRWTVTADHVVLYDDWSLYRSFTIIPYFPYFRRGKPFGMARNLLNPQEFYNKARSQELHIVNTTANSGWITEDGSLVNMTEDELSEKGAETGLHLVFARGSTPPQKISPNHVPTGLDRISDKTGMAIQQISGMNDGMMGQASAEVSGVAMDRKTQRGQIQMGQPFKHLAYSRKLVGKKLLELIQDFYTEERTVHILHPDDPEQRDEELVINQIDEVGNVLNNVTAGRYDVAITTLPTRDNVDEEEFAQMMQMRHEGGVAIPDDAIIRRSNLTDRDELADRIQKMLGQAEPTDEEIQMQQKLQQLEIGKLEGELAKLQAQAQQSQASAAKDMAAVEKEGGGMQSPEMQFEQQKLEAEIALKREELATRLRLSGMTLSAKSQGEQLRTAADLARTRFQGETQLAAAQANRSNPAEKGA